MVSRPSASPRSSSIRSVIDRDRGPDRGEGQAPGEGTSLPGRFELVTDLVPQGDQPTAIDEVTERVQRREKFVTLLGVTGSGKTFTMAHTVARLQRPTLVISPNKTLAAQLVSEFRALFPNNAVEYFVSYYDYYQPEAYVPQIDLYIEKDASINEEIEKLRHRATQALLTRRDVLIVASVSCIYGLGSPEDYRASVVELKVGDQRSRQALLDDLVHMKYARNDMELKRGRFRVRGGTIDIMGAGDTIHRIVLEGSTIASIVELENVTFEELREVDRLVVFPATHFLTIDERVRSVLGQINEDKEKRVAELLKEEKIVEAQRLKSRTEYDLEMIRETGDCSGIENYARYFSGRKPGRASVHAARLLPEGLSHVHRRVPRHDPPAQRDVQGGPRPEGEPGRLRLAPPLGQGQPTAQVPRVPHEGRPGRLRLRDPRTLRAEDLEGDRRADRSVRPGSWTPRSRSGRSRDTSRTWCPSSSSGPPAASGRS